MTFVLKSLSIVVVVTLATTAINAQTYTGLFRTTSGNTTYHQFNRDGAGAAVYINQENTTNAILRLSSGTAQANVNVRFTVENNGNVGIGTTTPQAKLSVNGNILATEVKVKTDINVPDYVFEPDYELPSLAEVEAYVKEHKHLPEIPSAADIQRDGLDLAEMNLLLLKKVEEMMLHLIEREKEHQALKEQVNIQNVLLEELKVKVSQISND
ncbi:hypothetical protein [Parapedobacter tibetensis]|uniref:hypothetical protein n=1 Tax=Parapedobacter tibetensis TaxID=2972951 RepID=UPI002152CF58|nr:hypothetical protein [Parapedobacter tibetensis]